MLLLGLNAVALLHGALALSQRRGWRARLFNALEKRAGSLLLSVGFVGAVLMLQLVFDARYRENMPWSVARLLS